MVQQTQRDDNEPENRSQRIRQVVEGCLRRRAEGESLSDGSIIEAHPDLLPGLAEELRKLRLITAAWQKAEQGPSVNADAGTDRRRGLEIRCPHCQTPVEMVADTPFTDITCSCCGSSFSLAGDETITRHAASITTIGHFELVERLGIGGFGTVWKARDTELDRTVTLKIPRAGQLDRVETEQFLREARTAAQLKHPNIVSVHEVGRDGETVYIVSDLVRGLSLADWLTGQRPTAPEAAGLCATIAEALHHAHQAGVVHRDLKPANIMIDADGHPHIMDFGLAKREAGEITLTTDGQVLGTPAYMPPEQAEGKGHQVDGRSDVYSLGVILFELLTGERPFRGNARMLIHQVIHDEPPSPRKLNSTIPRDLETICLKCLEKERARRYASAEDLAEELRRFLWGEPIHARPIGPAARLWRWCKRKPLVAGLAAAVASLLLFLAVAGPIVAVSQASLAARETEARGEAELAAEEALRNFRMARAAVDTFLTQVSQDPRLKAHDLEKLRTSLLETALKFYEQFVKQNPDDPRLRVDHARAYSRLGDIYSRLERFDQLEEAYGHAIAIWREIVRQEPDPSQHVTELASALHNLGQRRAVLRNNPDRAITELKEALRLRDDFAEAHPEILDNQIWRLDVRNVLAGVYLQQKLLDEAEALLKDALELRKRLPQEHLNHPKLQEVYVRTIQMRTVVQVLSYGAEGLEDALDELQKAIEIMESLPEKYRQDPEFQARLAMILTGAGNWMMHRNRLPEATQRLQAARRILEPVAERHPDMPGWQAMLGFLYYNFASVERHTKAPQDAADWYTKAINKYEQVLGKNQGTHVDRQVLRDSYLGRAQMFEALGRQKEAEADRRRAAEVEAQKPSMLRALGRALQRAISNRPDTDEVENRTPSK